MKKCLVVLLTISILVLTSCNSKLKDSELKIDELNGTISKLEEELKTKSDDIETYEKEIKFKSTKIVELENRIKANENNPKETMRNERYLKNILKIFRSLPNAYLDLEEYPAYKKVEVTDDLNRKYQDILSQYFRFIPNFKKIDDLSQRELIDTAILLYFHYNFGFVSRDLSKNYIPKEDLELVVKKVFVSEFNNHQNVNLADYKENKY